MSGTNTSPSVPLVTSTVQDVPDSSQAAYGSVKSSNEIKSVVSQDVEESQLSETSQAPVLSTQQLNEGTNLFYPCSYATFYMLLFLIFCAIRRVLSWFFSYNNIYIGCWLNGIIFFSLLHFVGVFDERCFIGFSLDNVFYPIVQRRYTVIFLYIAITR